LENARDQPMDESQRKVLEERIMDWKFYIERKERKLKLMKLLGRENRRKLKELWDKQKIAACDFRGWGTSKALEKAEKMGLQPEPIIFAGLVSQKFQVVGLIKAGNDTDGGAEFDPLRDDAYTFDELCEKVAECLEKGYDNVWVEIVSREKDSLSEAGSRRILTIKGNKVWNENGLRWETRDRDEE